MQNISKAVHPTKPTLSTADFNKEFVIDPIQKTNNLLFAQLLHAGKREETELWRFFKIDIFLEVIETNFNLEQIATIYEVASAFEEELKEQVESIDSDPEVFPYYYKHETDQVHNGVGMETIRSEWIPNDEMSQILGDLETFETITTKLQEHFDLEIYLEPQTA
jgi:hypothetical protein